MTGYCYFSTYYGPGIVQSALPVLPHFSSQPRTEVIYVVGWPVVPASSVSFLLDVWREGGGERGGGEAEKEGEGERRPLP